MNFKSKIFKLPQCQLNILKWRRIGMQKVNTNLKFSLVFPMVNIYTEQKNHTTTDFFKIALIGKYFELISSIKITFIYSKF